MFDNVGEKVKGLAKVYFGICVVVSIAVGIYVWINLTNKSAIGVLYMLLIVGFGIFAGWLTSLVFYAIGEASERNVGSTPKPVTSNAKFAELQQSLQLIERKIDLLQKETTGEETSEWAENSVAKTGHCQNCHSMDRPVKHCSVGSGKAKKQMNLCKECMEQLHATSLD